MLNFTDIAYVQNSTLVCLMNTKTKLYLTLDTANGIFRSNGIHSFLINKEYKSDIQTRSTFTLLLSSSPNTTNTKTKTVITYGTQISLMAPDETFIVGTNNGDIRIEQLKGDRTLTSFNLPINSKFTIIDPYNQSNFSKPLLFNDEIVLRSTFGGYLSSAGLSQPINNNGMIISEETIWKVVKSDAPFIPDWVYKRKYLNNNSVSYLYNLEKSFTSTRNKILSETNSKEKLSLLTLSTSNQDKCLVDDLLLVIIGLEGNYIKRVTSCNSFKDFKFEFKIEPHLENPTCDPPLVQLTNLILPLSFYYDSICNFLNLSSHNETGLVSKSFCSGLRKVLREYVLFVNQLEMEQRNCLINNTPHITLQQMWWLLQPSLKLLEHLHKLLQKCSLFYGGALINIVYSSYLHETDTEMKKLYEFLLNKSIEPFIASLKLWICKGTLEMDDKFMIQKTKDFNKEVLNEYYYDLFWDKKFVLNSTNTPEFLARVSDKILFIGKSLNVLKECGKIIQCPYEQDFNFPSITEILNNFDSLVEKIYIQTNETLKTNLYEEKNLLSLFKSIKKFYLMESGDFHTHLIDLAEEMLLAEKNKINFDKFYSHIDNAIRNTSANGDVNKDLFQFHLSNMVISTEKIYLDKYIEIISSNVSMKERIALIRNLDLSTDTNEYEESKILESLILEMKVVWPMNLIFSKTSMIKYKILFRQLLILKYEERELNETWILQQNFKEFRLQNYLKPSYLLRDKMLNFVKSLIYYYFNEVIEPQYLKFLNNLIASTSIEEMIKSHDHFLDNCLKECLLDDVEILKDLNDIIHCTFFFSRLIIKYYNSAIMDEKLIHHQHSNLNTRNASERKKFRIEEQSKVMEEIFIAGKHKFLNTVDKFRQTFEGRLEMFLEKIDKINTKQNPHLINLLTKLDYNNYYHDKFRKLKF